MAQPAEKPKWEGGMVLFAGGTDWSGLGRSVGKAKPDAKAELERQQKYPNLPDPHKLKSLLDVKVAFVAAGSAAVHCVIGDINGVCYTWGRNEKGQLGHGDQLQRNAPTIVKGMEGMKVLGACGGRHHTVVYTDTGDSYTWGLNTQGQCGIGKINKKGGKADDLQLVPVKAQIEGVSAVSAGMDFTVWLCTGGNVWAAGFPQYGQLGDGSDHMFNASDSSIKIVYEPQPTPAMIKDLEQINIVRLACGHNHTIAIDDKGHAFTWGNGNYGKLGHKVQQDEMRPRPIESFKGRLMVVPEGVVAAGGTSTFCIGTGNQLYGWGKLKVSGDNTTHPAPVYDLQGWNIHSMACGPATYAVAADRSVITWGHGQNGELGYGAKGKKSSANPAKCNDLDEMYTHQVATGTGFTLFLVQPSPGLDKLPTWEPSVAVEEAPLVVDDDGAGAAGSSKAGKGAAGAKRKAAPASGRAKR